MMIKALQHLTCKERLIQLCLFSLDKRGLRGILLMRENKANKARLFSLWPSDRTRGNGSYFKYE